MQKGLPPDAEEALCGAVRLYDFLGLQRLIVSLKHYCAKRIVDTF